MFEQKIEDCICELLAEDVKEIAMDFVSFLRANNMQFERATGYWKDQCYWFVKFQEEYMCFKIME